MYRQGDILLVKTTKAIRGQLKDSGIIVEGEVTGHAHKILDGLVYEDDEGNIFVKADINTKLVHEEHKTIDLESGDYEVIRQRELYGRVED